jgi:hypothetical protein
MEGILADTDWDRAWNFGPLKFDDLVGKTGSFMGGMYSSFKPGGRFNEQVSGEYWALQDNSISSSPFARRGGSGSAVINSQGYIVGFGFAHVEIDVLKTLIDQNRNVLDIPMINKRWQVDGSVNIEGLVSGNFIGRNLSSSSQRKWLRKGDKKRGWNWC